MNLALVSACADRSVASAETTSSESSTTIATLAASSDSTTNTNGDSTSTTTGGCVPRVDIGAFTQISALAIGTTERYDMDRDGRLDVVGGRGVVVSADLEVEVIVDDAPNELGHPGVFDGDDLPDMAWAVPSPSGFVVYPASGGEPVVSALPESVYFDARDVDGDGIDDVAIYESGNTSVWRGSASGSFTKLADVQSAATAYPTFFRHADGIYLAVSDEYSVDFEVYRYDAGTFTLATTFMLLQAYSLDAVIPFEDDTEYLLATQSWTQLTTMSSIGLFLMEDDGWTGWGVDFDGQLPLNAALGDLDDDGIGEIAVASEGGWLAILCWTGEDLALCGEREDLPGLQVELMRGRVLAAGDGVWVADATLSACR